MSAIYHEGNRELQDRFASRQLADRLAEKAVKNQIGPGAKAFIEAADMFFLATADENGQPNCSYKGGEPGFVRVLDDQTIAFPSYDGNGMFLSLGNVTRNPRVGLLFIDFQRQQRLRLNGVASIDENDPLRGEYPEAQLIVRVRLGAVFPNCPRYIHKYELVERSRFVPRAGVETPVPDWKKSDNFRDVVPPAPRSRPAND